MSKTPYKLKRAGKTGLNACKKPWVALKRKCPSLIATLFRVILTPAFRRGPNEFGGEKPLDKDPREE
ncbi:hypothetical protein MTHERMOG20_12290 [Moorella thermoacetica]|nr:hypothetical protein MTHERMOG20_12290 [Moorella thermoacetica]